MGDSINILALFLIVGFYILGLVWVPAFIFFQNKQKLFSILLLLLNAYLIYDWFDFITNELPENETGFVIVGLIIILPPYITIVDIIIAFLFYTLKHAYGWLRCKLADDKKLST